MEWWLATAMDLAQERAPQLTDEHANDLAGNLYRAWPDDTPAVAVDKFFMIVGPTWKPLRSSTVH